MTLSLWRVAWLFGLLAPLLAQAQPATLLFTGNVRGELPACACSRAPPGGVARLKTLLVRQAGQGPTVVVVGGDALFFDVGAPDADAQRRAVYLLELLGRLGAAAFVPGPFDLAAGAPFLQQHAAKVKVPVLSANLTNKAGRPFPGSRVVVAGTTRLALIGVSAEGPAPGAGRFVGGPTLPAVQAELKRLGPHDATVVFVAGGWAQGEALAKALEGQVAAVVVAGELHPERPPSRVGTTWLLAVAPHGQSVGSLSFADGLAFDALPLGLGVMEDDLVKAEVTALHPPSIYR